MDLAHLLRTVPGVCPLFLDAWSNVALSRCTSRAVLTAAAGDPAWKLYGATLLEAARYFSEDHERAAVRTLVESGVSKVEPAAIADSTWGDDPVYGLVLTAFGASNTQTTRLNPQPVRPSKRATPPRTRR